MCAALDSDLEQEIAIRRRLALHDESLRDAARALAPSAQEQSKDAKSTSGKEKSKAEPLTQAKI